MNIEDYRDYCLSLGADVEEKQPFTAFHYASGVQFFNLCYRLAYPLNTFATKFIAYGK